MKELWWSFSLVNLELIAGPGASKEKLFENADDAKQRTTVPVHPISFLRAFGPREIKTPFLF